MAEAGIADKRSRSKANGAVGPHKAVPVDTTFATVPATVTKSVAAGENHTDEATLDRGTSSAADSVGLINLNLSSKEVSEPAKRSNDKSTDANIANVKPDEVPSIEKLFFERMRWEVLALIDFVPTRNSDALSNLAIPHPDEPDKKMFSSAILQAIDRMRYQTRMDAASAQENARHVDILLLVREKLCALAAPATPRTIAYTQMFTDSERHQLLSARTDSNNPLDAASVYPKLEKHAQKFRKWRDTLATLTVFWLVLTGLAYWDAGLGRAALERLDQNWKTLVDRVKTNPELIQCADRTEVNNGEENAIRKQFACLEHNYLRRVVETAGAQVNDVFRCAGMEFTRIPHVWCWDWLLAGPSEPKVKSKREDSLASTMLSALTAHIWPAGLKQQTVNLSNEVPDYARVNIGYWQSATAILSVFTTYILPMMFALLGTLIGAFRAILNRVRSYELSPRDLVRMQLGIPAGLVAGIAVGLFLSPSSMPMQGAGAVSGQLTLTASGLGFLAGYASYSFFGFLDNLIRTVFSVVPSGRGSTRPPVGQQHVGG